MCRRLSLVSLVLLLSACGESKSPTEDNDHQSFVDGSSSSGTNSADADYDDPREGGFDAAMSPGGEPDSGIVDDDKPDSGTRSLSEDWDQDGVVDALDNCWRIANPRQANHDNDEWGNACDVNDDNDDFSDTKDNCPTVSNDDQSDLDEDQLGDKCDTDQDGDGWSDDDELICGSSPTRKANIPTDLDGDTTCDTVDPDDDNDGVEDPFDTAPVNPSSCKDSDQDGCDDCSVTQANESGGDPNDDGVDSDVDGTCNVADQDDDDDGVADVLDTAPTDASVCSDEDADGCDDCSVTLNDKSGGDVANDGTDTDSDGACDVSDSDDDADGVDDDDDADSLDPLVCRDLDQDTCDDCTNTGADGSGGSRYGDGDDLDLDWLCDLGDPDIDGDLTPNENDIAPMDNTACGDVDIDGCDDCHFGHGPNEDGCNVVALATGYDHTCAAVPYGLTKCWGDNSRGQLGLGDTESRGDDPNEMGSALPFVDLGEKASDPAEPFVSNLTVRTGEAHTCALFDYKVKCWGANDVGQLGIGTTEDMGDEEGEMGTTLPFVDLDEPGIWKLAVGGAHSCVVFYSGKVKCWGANEHGQLGLGDVQPRGGSASTMGSNLPFVELGERIVYDIALGKHHTCVSFDDGSVGCWGAGANGTLGYDVSDHPQVGDNVGDEPGEIEALVAIDPDPSPWVTSALSAGAFHTCALTAFAGVVCWGDATSPALPLGDYPTYRNPMEIALSFKPSAIATGGQHSCTIGSLGISCWGANTYGQLGYGDDETRGDEADEMGEHLGTNDIPAERAESVVTGRRHSCSLSSDQYNEVRCWGYAPVLGLGWGEEDGNIGDDPDELDGSSGVVELFPEAILE